MLITTRLRYAIMFMSKLAQEYYTLKGSIQPKKMSHIANSQSLSEGYLEQIIVKLKKQELISSTKGPGGGYSLNKSPDLITLNLILKSIGENVKITRCKNDLMGCLSNNARCITHNLWENIGNHIKKYLNSISLEDIVNNNFKSTVSSNINQYIYADYNSMSTISPMVKNQLDNLSSLNIYNPSSTHKLGQNTKSIIEKTREIAINQLNATNYDVIFTSSGTEANNLVINSTAGYKHLISSIEHLSIMNCATNAELIPVNSNGIVCLDTLSDILRKFKDEKVLVSIMTANNETGVIQPIKEIVEISHKFGAIVHTDAIQACGKIHIDIEDLGVDLLTVSSHKLGSIAGTGILFFNSKKIKIKPIILGGHQEKGLRAGTENVISIYLLSISLSNLEDSVKKMSTIEKLRDKLEREILNLVPEAQIFGKNARRLPNTTCISMPNVNSEIQIISFDIDNIAVGSGSACSSGALERSHVLAAMGVDDNIAKNSIRISLSHDATDTQVTKIVNCWYKIYQNNQLLKLN
ncbi:aminotransferase class V-fold PLP-dependent enzyme [Ehrlichia japonica]|uniref:cysteine desulfurase n=1 Tax=Ehrlichia japonica TaxID=391036 RepID=X5GBS4_9RICK|nr:aminotransferase class V-fold PLP-dependent enzyme [Ehrlichia japonica]AHX04507.1 rrf2 family protein [Ehrlichia japonica]